MSRRAISRRAISQPLSMSIPSHHHLLCGAEFILDPILVIGVIGELS